jgi:hypothetical protein
MKKIVTVLIYSILFMSSLIFAQDTTIHEYGLTVNGTIESTYGGVVFPDGTIQTSAKPDIVVYDANDQFLGVSGYMESGRVWMYIPARKEYFYLSLDTGDLYEDYLYFTSTDCTGSPFCHPLHTYQSFKNGNNYYKGDSVAPINMQVNSLLTASGQCEQWTQTDLFVPVIPTTPPFSLPVALPFRFEME